jgi:glutathione S-transferase
VTVIHVQGRRNSMNVQKVMWALGELALGYRREDVGGSFGYPDDYPARNPNRVVPTLQDGELVMWDSNACVRYLARTYGHGGLWPEETRTLAHADQWMDWQATSAGPAFMRVFINQIRRSSEQADQAQMAAGLKGCARCYELLDDHLSKQPYVAGDEFSMGDIPIGTMSYRYLALEIERPALAHVDAWYQRLAERAAYQHHVMIPFGRNPEEWQAAEDENARLQ